MNDKSVQLGQNGDFIAGEESPKKNDYKGFDEEFEDALSTPQNLVVGCRFENYSNCLKIWIESRSKYSDPPKTEDLLLLRKSILDYAESLSPLKPKKNLPTQRTLEKSIAIILQRGGIKKFKYTNDLFGQAKIKLEKIGINENNINYLTVIRQQIEALKWDCKRNKKNELFIKRINLFNQIIGEYKDCLINNKSTVELDQKLLEFKSEIERFQESRSLPATTPTLEVIARMIIQHEAQRPFLALYRFLTEAGIINHEGQHHWIDDSRIREKKKTIVARLKKSRYRAR